MTPLYNKPHIIKFLNSRFMQFVMTHIQNLCWTLERLLGGPEVDEYYIQKVTEDQSWLAVNYKQLVIAHANFVIQQQLGQDQNFNREINIAVIIPSRLGFSDHDGDFIFKKAIDSIKKQEYVAHVKFDIIVAVDINAEIPDSISPEEVKFVKSSGRSQALALNAGIDHIPEHADYVAILEDDDQWHPSYASWALAALTFSDFVSSNQLERNEMGDIIKVSDFPTPSGWMMPISVLNQVGKFDTSFRWHLDNEWLGRLGKSGLKRCHLVECNAPTTIHAAEGRHGIVQVFLYGGKTSFVHRHAKEGPLVYRMMHSGSGMHAIRTDSIIALESKKEREELKSRYGYLPC